MSDTLEENSGDHGAPLKNQVLKHQFLQHRLRKHRFFDTKHLLTKTSIVLNIDCSKHQLSKTSTIQLID